MTADFSFLGEGLPVEHAGEPLPDATRSRPNLVYNRNDNTALRVIREELAQAEVFLFSVAFVTPSAVSLLKTDLWRFAGRGTLVTSDYLGFNSPRVFAELQKLQEHGIDVRIHESSAFHPKGYVFARGDTFTAMVGSSNLTDRALVKNHEWNLRVAAARDSDLGRQIHSLWDEQVSESFPLTTAWLDAYTKSYVPPSSRPVQLPRQSPGDPLQAIADARATTPSTPPRILPNRMQREALQAIADVRSAGSRRALIISATGTGKTILSALDVRAMNPARMLFVVHREQILARSMEEYGRVLGIPVEEFGLIAGSRRDIGHGHCFAMIQTLSRPEVLKDIGPRTFDYIVLDEAHRAGSESYRRVLDHFCPTWLLGMTATPERTDGFDVYSLFEHTVPYEIRLQQALEEEMLAPFHYFGVADLTYDDGTTTTDTTPLTKLVAPARIRHLLHAIEEYGQAGVAPRGLIFCSRREEAQSISAALNDSRLNGRSLRTQALTGDDTAQRRADAVRRFEAGELDYLVTVDIFNEGIDIPSVNQVIMLRQTKSAIVFVQQLGRGLRLAPEKDYVVVIDMIGNYENNFMIPAALFSDSSLDKESLRKNLLAAEEAGVVAGVSSVRFDRVAQARVMESITAAKVDSMHRIRDAIRTMAQRVGGMPRLMDYWRFDSVDPVVLAAKSTNYPSLAARVLNLPVDLTPEQSQALELLSLEVLPAKRPHEAVLLRALIEAGGSLSWDAVRDALDTGVGSGESRLAASAVSTFTLADHAAVDWKRYHRPLALVAGDNSVALTPSFRRDVDESPTFRGHVEDLIATNLAMAAQLYPEQPFTPGRQYDRKEVCRLLGWPRKWSSTLYGYRAEVASGMCPIFVTLHKSDEVSASTRYEDELLDRHTMRWFTRSKRTLRSEEVKSIVDGAVQPLVFVKKDDAEGSSFYFLGSAVPSQAEQTTIVDGAGRTAPIVTMLLTFLEPIPVALYDYFHPVVTTAVPVPADQVATIATEVAT